MYKKGYVLTAGAFLVLLFVFLVFYRNSGTLTASPLFQSGKPQDLPVANFEEETSKEKSKARKQKDAHFNSRGKGDRAIFELPPGSEPLPTAAYWWRGLPRLPVNQSDAVVLADVIVREAHLSADHTSVYSEFTLQPVEIFKDATKTISQGAQFSVNRSGGAVGFASGKIQNYTTPGQDMPRSGSRYVLFLHKTVDGDFIILTGYELSAGKVTPLDGEDTTDPRSALPFAKYRGADEAAFLIDLRDELTKNGKGDSP